MNLKSDAKPALFAVPCPACESTTYWVDCDGKPELIRQPYCTCEWNLHDKIAVLESALDLMPNDEAATESESAPLQGRKI